MSNRSRVPKGVTAGGQYARSSGGKPADLPDKTTISSQSPAPPNIQPAHIARHTPASAGAQGDEAAIIDVAQDLLLRDLECEGFLDTVTFKGGTALRKMWAGAAGRFSLDLDFSCAAIDADLDEVLTDLIAAIDGRAIGPFTYGTAARRGKWMVNFQHPFGGEPALSCKLDLSPPPWLPPIRRGWVPLPIHAHYGAPPMPELPIVRLEENLAEKIARLNRTTTARDMYDLHWVATAPSVASRLDKPLIRRLAVLKMWVDANGLRVGRMHWKPGHEGPAFNPKQWLRRRPTAEFENDVLGALAVVVPSAQELSEAVSAHYGFLGDLNPEEQVIARASEADRSLALRMLTDLPGGRMRGIGIY